METKNGIGLTSFYDVFEIHDGPPEKLGQWIRAAIHAMSAVSEIYKMKNCNVYFRDTFGQYWRWHWDGNTISQPFASSLVASISCMPPSGWRQAIEEQGVELFPIERVTDHQSMIKACQYFVGFYTHKNQLKYIGSKDFDELRMCIGRKLRATKPHRAAKSKSSRKRRRTGRK